MLGNPKYLDNQHITIIYGMRIDSDNDITTGFNGTDYSLAITYNNYSFYRTLYQWSPRGEEFPILNETIDPYYSGGLHLSLDLNQITHGDFYKVQSYAESYNNTNRDQGSFDTTVPLHFPPLHVSISTSLPALTMRAGDSRTVEVMINSTKGYEPMVMLAANNTGDIKTALGFNQFRMPSSGFATIPLEIHALRNATARPYTLFITAKSTLKTPEISQPFLHESTIVSGHTMTIVVNPPLGFWELLQGSGVTVKIPQEYLVGFYAIVLSLVVPGTARWFSKRREIKHLNQLMTNINTTYDLKSDNKKEMDSNLESIRRQVDEAFGKGRISEANYKILNEKISDYQKKINTEEDKSGEP